eukprot:jgi/Bigna1/79681/fgenesh1_pg.64_\
MGGGFMKEYKLFLAEENTQSTANTDIISFYQADLGEDLALIQGICPDDSDREAASLAQSLSGRDVRAKKGTEGRTKFSLIQSHSEGSFSSDEVPWKQYWERDLPILGRRRRRVLVASEEDDSEDGRKHGGEEAGKIARASSGETSGRDLIIG